MLYLGKHIFVGKTENDFFKTKATNHGTTASILTTVKPVLSGPVLNGHPLLSGQLQKSRKFLLLTTLNVTALLNGHLY